MLLARLTELNWLQRVHDLSKDEHDLSPQHDLPTAKPDGLHLMHVPHLSAAAKDVDYQDSSVVSMDQLQENNKVPTEPRKAAKKAAAEVSTRLAAELVAANKAADEVATKEAAVKEAAAKNRTQAQPHAVEPDDPPLLHEPDHSKLEPDGLHLRHGQDPSADKHDGLVHLHAETLPTTAHDDLHLLLHEQDFSRADGGLNLLHTQVSRLYSLWIIFTTIFSILLVCYSPHHLAHSFYEFKARRLKNEGLKIETEETNYLIHTRQFLTKSWKSIEFKQKDCQNWAPP